MGENSIINISESSVNECGEDTREERAVRVSDCPNTTNIRSNGVDRLCQRVVEEAKKRKTVEARKNIGVVGLVIAEERCKRTRRVILEEAKESRRETEVARSRRKNVKSHKFRVFRRLFLLSTSLLGCPLPPAAWSTSSQEYTRGATLRGPATLVSGSFLALVGLAIAVMLRPAMAIPTTSSFVTSSDARASGGTGTSASDPTFFGDKNVARIAPQGGASEFFVIEESDARDDRTMNLKGVAGATTTRLYRGDVEYASRRSSNRHEEEEEEKEEEEEEEDEEEDAFPASFIPHTRESGHETRSQLREPELDTIRRSIVEGLGLKRIPDPSKANVSQAEYRRAHEEYLTRLQHSRDSVDGRQRRLDTFHPAAAPADNLIWRSRRSPANELIGEDVPTSMERGAHLLYFPISIPEENYVVDHASLRLLLDPRDTAIEITKHVISLHHLVGPSSRLMISQKLLPNFSLSDDSDGGGGPRWIELEATELASQWLDGKNATDLVVELSFESHETGSRFDHREKRPLVLEAAFNIFTTSYNENERRSLIRRKRRANPEHLMSLHKGRRTECRGENKKCCRHEMIVIFKDLKGFEFIVQPKNFDAGYCKGRCPPRYNPAHHHALLQSLIWKEDRRKAPRPCCAPSKLDELEILYFDENDPTKLKISSWKNMKVLECACS